MSINHVYDNLVGRALRDRQRNSDMKSYNIFSSLVIHGIIGIIVKLLLYCRVKQINDYVNVISIRERSYKYNTKEHMSHFPNLIGIFIMNSRFFLIIYCVGTGLGTSTP